MYVYSKSNIGYSHLDKNIVCQDFSASYSDKDRSIITCCDGHGGKIYIRSNFGSKFASNAIIRIFSDITAYSLRGDPSEDYLNQIKLAILCEWNRQVEEHVEHKPFRKEEFEGLSDKEIEKIKNNPAKAYGTTMIGAMTVGNKLIVVHIGDGESILLKKGQFEVAFDEDEDEPVANMTYSMCEEDAYDHIKIKVVDFNSYDGVILCTDGMVNPYQNYANFYKSLVGPMVNEIVTTNSYAEISNHVTNLATNLGTGDDVSLAFILSESIKKQY